MIFNKYWKKYPSGLTLPEQFVNLLGYTKEIDNEVDNKTDLTGDHLGSWQGINKPTMSEEGMRGTVEKINEVDIPLINSNLEDMVINVKNYGAVGDGVTDDAPSIRVAIAKLKEIGGGTLYFPSGTYFVSSGDERGMNCNGIMSKGGYYTVFEHIPNLIIKGNGESSVILYDTNRLGYNLSSNRGDLGCLFGNIRVTQNDSVPFVVGGMNKLSDIKISFTDFNPDESGARDVIEGHIIKIMENPATENGVFVVENTIITNAPSRQLFHITGAKKILVRNNTLKDLGYYVNRKLEDHSTFFLNGNKVDVSSNIINGGSEQFYSGTSFEIHGDDVTVNDNKVNNMSTFLNAVGNVELNAKFKVYGNIAYNVPKFVVGWVYSNKQTEMIEIKNNNFYCYGDTPERTEYVFTSNNDSGETVATTKPIMNVIIENNNIETIKLLDSNMINTATNSNYLFNCIDNIENLTIKNNIIKGSRRGLINVSSARLVNLEITGNTGENLVARTPSGTTTNLIYYTIAPAINNKKLNRLIINNNNFRAYDKTVVLYGININTRTQEIVNDKDFEIINNTLLNCGNEIRIFSSTSQGQFLNSYYLKHKFNSYTIADSDSYARLLYCLDSDINSLKVGSSCELKSTENGHLVTLEKNLESNWRAVTYGATFPTSRYWSRGSICYSTSTNISTGPVYWVCSEPSSTGGTWLEK